ncbi:transporter [Phenylobacterium sp.]|uniref:transporter n=1 Tax=Phenylobacterium sp. TaxID=1871053 RepID=UPI0035B09AFB|nr:transporter [Pseudomonadota bacterium]
MRRPAFTLLRLLAGLVLTVLLTLAAAPARAQDDGPRVYQLAPVGAQTITGFAVAKRGNEGPEPGDVHPGSEIDTDILVLRYARTLEAAGRPLTPFVILPVGEVRATGAPASSGFGDAQIGGTLGLLGSPALTPEAFAAYRPRFGLAVLGRIFLPTGAYSSAQPVNFGANRVSYQLGLPLSLANARPYRETGFTSLEVLPTLTFYEDNTEPFGADRNAKDPLFSVEAHLIRNLAPGIWASADLLYRQGGEIQVDGVASGDHTRGWSAGASLAVPFTDRASAIFTYQQVVERDDDGPDGWFFRTALVVPF